MRIAVTGGNGRLGRAVVAAALAAGNDVVSLDRATGDTAHGPAQHPTAALDVTDYDAFAASLTGCDALVHLAAMPSPHQAPAQTVHANNVLGNYHALLAAAEAGIRRVVTASSINAIGGHYSRKPRYDYLPLDEDHPTYAEDAYSLSKWLGEQQADAVCRLHEDMTVSSLRFHWITPQPPSWGVGDEQALQTHAKHMWGWTSRDAAVRSCLLGLSATFTGHEAFFVVAPTTLATVSSAELHARFHPDVPVRHPLTGSAGFYDCSKATKLLGWTHDSA